MLTPDILASCSDDIVSLYSQLETDIISDIARRIAKTGRITESAQWQAAMAQEQGALFNEIINRVAIANNLNFKEVEQLFNASVNKSVAFDNRIYKAAGLSPIVLAKSPSAIQTLLAGIEKTKGNLKNMTMSTAISSQKAFFDNANMAYMQIQSGAFDSNTAISNACNNLAKNGIQTIDYASGAYISIEGGVRRAVMTGINQTAQQISLDNAEELDCDLVETSAHAGARPDHEVWQGQVFSLKGATAKYDDFYLATGYGEGDGLGGWNCRHSFFPYFEGSDRAYDTETLNEYANETVTAEGKEYTQYEAEQRMRQIERNIRGYKKQEIALESAGVDAGIAKAKVKEWQAQARSFTNQTGIRRDYAREKIYKIA